jgi:hypothetical protein
MSQQYIIDYLLAKDVKESFDALHDEARKNAIGVM